MSTLTRADMVRDFTDAQLRDCADYLIDLGVKGIDYDPSALDEVMGELERRLRTRLRNAA
mgnify:CR=1 FL=1